MSNFAIGMKRRTLYRITITDESRLERRGSWLWRPWKLALAGAGVALLLMGAGASLVWLTPMRQMMPGYMRKEQRAAYEMVALRLDSIAERLEANRLYMENLRMVLDPDREPARIDTTRQELPAQDLDSMLLMPSENEERFVASIGKRDRFNSTVLAPLDAEGMIFHFPVTTGAFSSPEESLTASLLMAGEGTVCSVAEGRVVGVARSTRERGYIIWIQHSNGFLSRYSRLGSPLVDQGTLVAGGEAIALPARSTGTAAHLISIQLFHNGEPLAPARFLPQPDSGAFKNNAS